MKKSFLMFAMVMAAMFAHATDSYLYWMMDSLPDTFSDGYVSVKDSNGTYLTFGDGTSDIAVAQTGYRYMNVVTLSSGSYIFELWNESSDDPVFATEAISYAALSQYVASAGEHAPTGSFSLSGGDFHAVPEPTSGLMVLLGAAMLGLKRKKQA